MFNSFSPEIITNKFNTMNTIKVNTGIQTLTFTEEQILDDYYNKSILESILLMLIEGSDTFENHFEVEFPKSEAKPFLEEYFKDSAYDKKYIKKVLGNLI